LDGRKNGLKEHHPHKLLTYAIGCNAREYRIRFGLDVSFDTTVEVECCTEAKMNGVIYRSSPNFLGRAWYDWGLFEFPETDDSEGNISSAAQILGFFRYKSEDALTYGKIEMEGKSYDECLGVKDENVYVALRCQRKYLHYSHLERRMIRKITMEDDDHLYILPLKQLRGPLLVVPDVVDEGKVSNSNYIVIAAKSVWGNYFLEYIKRTEEDGRVEDDSSMEYDDGESAEYEGSDEDEDSWVRTYDSDDW
jgi:hypothetical protein